MIRNILTIGAAAIALASVSGPATSQSLPIEWTISPARSEGAGEMVQLSFGYRTQNNQSMNSGSYRLDELQGLTARQLSSNQGTPANFRLVREAGTVDCRGIVHQWRGVGDCAFLPDTRFAAALERRGLDRPSLREQYQLTIAGAGTELLDELDRQGYGKPTTKELVSASIHRVTVPYVRSMAQSGYRLGEVDDLVKFRIHGVTSDYIREMSVLNPPGGRFSPEDLVRMRIHGLTGTKIRDYAAIGYRNLSRDQLLKMSIHGVTPAFIREMSQAGYRDLDPEDLVRMRIHGVTPEYIRNMRAAGYTLPTADQLVRMRISGFRPDRRRD